MATSARKQPQSSDLSSTTVCDAANISDSEVSNQNTDIDAELSGCENEPAEPSSNTDLGAGNENVT